MKVVASTGRVVFAIGFPIRLNNDGFLNKGDLRAGDEFVSSIRRNAIIKTKTKSVGGGTQGRRELTLEKYANRIRAPKRIRHTQMAIIRKRKAQLVQSELLVCEIN